MPNDEFDNLASVPRLALHGYGELGDALGVSKTTARLLVEAGRLPQPSVALRDVKLWSVKAVDEFLQAGGVK